MRQKSVTRGIMLVLAWAGLAVSVYLLYLASWYHQNVDVILRIPFVFFFGIGGLLLGLSCLVYIIKGHLTGMSWPFS